MSHKLVVIKISIYISKHPYAFINCNVFTLESLPQISHFFQGLRTITAALNSTRLVSLDDDKILMEETF